VVLSVGNTISPGLRPTSVPSGILIHPTVWPQYSNDKHRTESYDKPVGFYGPIAPPRSVVRIRGMMRTQHFWIRASLSSTAAARRHAASRLTAAACYDRREVAGMANSKCISYVSFVRIESNLFYNTHETQTQKMMDQNFEIRIL